MIGVPVKLTAKGSDGMVIDIDGTKTNGYCATFGYGWIPQNEDKYTIIAKFAADE